MNETWQDINGFLTKEFVFNNFREALIFVNGVGELAEEDQHHPDILIHDYKQVTLKLRTHDADAITEKDHALAEKIDSLAL